MSTQRLFLDTTFIQAVLNHRDQYHLPAIALLPQVQQAKEVWTTEAILMEVGNALSNQDRSATAAFLQRLYTTPNVKVVSIDPPLFQEGLELYKSRTDKTWGLVDCISFIVMTRNKLSQALTADRHFKQAGFQTLL